MTGTTCLICRGNRSQAHYESCIQNCLHLKNCSSTYDNIICWFGRQHKKCLQIQPSNTNCLHCKLVMRVNNEPCIWTDSLDKRSKWWNMDMRFGTWNIRSFYMAGSIMTVLRELSRYRLDLVGVQEVWWEGSGTTPAEEYIFFYGKGNENHEFGTGFFVHKWIISAAKKVEFVGDRMSYIIQRCHWFHIIVLNVHAPTEG
jgi:hypothetical protein